MPEITVASWSQLQDELYAGSWNPELARFRSRMAFRGSPDAVYDLRTSLMRLGGDYSRHEGHLLRNFRKYAQQTEVRADSTWDWLAVAQHHGLPTRLLDWTYSPYVALHFVTADLETYGADGVVWCVDFTRTNQFLPRPLRQLLQEEGSDVFTGELLSQAAQTLGGLERLAAEEFLLFLEPPSLDARIVNQFALFALMSRAIARLDQWLSDRPECWRRLRIPARLKWEIRDKLDQANLSERVLFPGLDGLSSWLKRYYSPGPR